MVPDCQAALPDPQAADRDRPRLRVFLSVGLGAAWWCDLAKTFMARFCRLVGGGAYRVLTWWGPLTTPRGALGDCPNHLKLRCWGHPGPLVPGRHLHRSQRVFAKANSPQRPVGILGGEHTPRAHGSQLRTPHCKLEREAAAQRAGPFPSTQQVRSHPDTTAEQVACRLKRAESLFFFFFFSVFPFVFSFLC